MARSVLSDGTEVSAAQYTRLSQSDRFYTKPKTTDGKDFFIFAEYGDFLKGKLYSRQNNHHMNRTCSYRIAVEEMRQNGIDKAVERNQVEEFFANRQLRRIIEKNELVGSIVRIVFVGRLKSGFGGHAEKVYRVFKEKGTFTSQEEIQNEPKKRKYTRAKPGRSRQRIEATV